MHVFKSLASGPLSVFMSGPGTFATDFFSTSGLSTGQKARRVSKFHAAGHQIAFICGKT